MNKRKLLVVGIFLIIIAGLGSLVAYEYLIPKYKDFIDERIEVEIPNSFNFHFEDKDSLF
ncbi:hypothetical protein ALNOE001_01160 [Candidatus Methanobinarius endosymbioticus]|uniref:Uncharacterized protein n=1 Tax=Candidatus Methanobinarius endosymbioticus TaxID=2006182 RepID=A0A366MG31_9EURY|nr:hypothetical protein ALNOE001_01160 [Candidatus Methanobinarius endosymbioticus]